MKRRGRSPCNRKRKTPQKRRKRKTKPAQLCVKRYWRSKLKANQVIHYRPNRQKRRVTKRRVRKRAAPRPPEIYVLYCKQKPPKKSIFSNLKC